MHKPACFILALFLAVCATAAPRSANADIKKVTSVEGITEYRLDNGLQLLLYPDSSRPTVTVNLTILVGSRHEGYGETGMAHLLEHMVFKGTPKHQSIPKLLQERGARFNGTTWVDRTNYFETLPANEDNLKFALELESYVWAMLVLTLVIFAEKVLPLGRRVSQAVGMVFLVLGLLVASGATGLPWTA